MCVTCGCSDNTEVKITNPQTGETQPHSHILADGTVVTHTHTLHPPDSPDRATSAQAHTHSHTLTDGTLVTHTHLEHDGHQHLTAVTDAPVVHAQRHGTTITVEQEILRKNELIAAQNRGWFKGRNILALNLVSSPGAGKTSLLVRTINDLKDEIPISVIEGDQETINDAQKIKETGCKVIQINTGTGCHLDASMVERGYTELNPPLHSIVAIENVGNLVCPALFDLGEQTKVAILSVTEGEDKPLKYPYMFRASSVIVLTKIDLLPFVPFDVHRCLQYARQVNPHVQIFQVSALTGEGMGDWYGWLKSQFQEHCYHRQEFVLK